MLCQRVPSCAPAREYKAWIALGLSRQAGHCRARPGKPQDRRFCITIEGVEFRRFSPKIGISLRLREGTNPKKIPIGTRDWAAEIEVFH